MGRSWGRGSSASALLAVLLAACGPAGSGNGGTPNDDANLDGKGGGGGVDSPIDEPGDKTVDGIDGKILGIKRLPHKPPKDGNGGSGGDDGYGGSGGNDQQEEEEQNYCQVRKTVAVAVEGEEVPGTGGLRFDAIYGLYSSTGFADPKVNEKGNVAFAASYSEPQYGAPSLQAAVEEGAGIFFWSKQYKDLTPVGLTGQMTASGLLPAYLTDFNGPAFNDHDQVAFSVLRHPTGRSAVFQWSPSPYPELRVLADETDWVPGANSYTFWEFGEVAENDKGDVAFVGIYDYGYKNGVFLKKHNSYDLRAIVNWGDELPGTRGGTLCGPGDGYLVGGPWINDDGDVLFQANCIRGGTPGLEGSVFMRRSGHDQIEPLVLIGESLPGFGEGTIKAIHIGQPGVNDQNVAMLIDVEGGKSEKVIATRELTGNDWGLDVCARQDQRLEYGMELELYGAPTIAEDGVITFAGAAERISNDYPIHRTAIFTCDNGDVEVVAAQGDVKPVAPWHFYGILGDASSADYHEVWLDKGKIPEMAQSAYIPSWGSLTGVFTDDGYEKCMKPSAHAVAVEGQVAPGTYGQRFDPVYEVPYGGTDGGDMTTDSIPTGGSTGFDEPMINEDGNVAFIASYGYNSGAGVFGWKKQEEFLFAIALAGQETPVGLLPGYVDNYSGPALNDRNQVAFSARNIDMYGSYGSAVFLTGFHEPLTVVSASGEAVPGGGYFSEFFDVALNERGDLAFNATFDYGYGDGIFLAPHDGTALQAIVRTGDLLPDTEGGHLCGWIGGPWINEDGVVLFQANCVDGHPEFNGSIFMRKPGHSVEALVLRGDRLPSGGWIDEISTGKPGIVENEFAMLLKVVGGNGSYKVIATKELQRYDAIEVCASQGQDLGYHFELVLDDGPSIAEDGTIAFTGKARNTEYWFESSAVFTCKDGNTEFVASQGEVKPGWRNSFGMLDEASNADGWAVFLDEGGSYPTGVYSVRLQNNDSGY